jgi:hypothetical protein
MKPIEMLAHFDCMGLPTPKKFKLIDNNDLPTVIQVDRVSFRAEEKLAGNRVILFRCQSSINDQVKVFELKYELSTCKWFLWKI